MRPLIIGYGNPLREDDGLGPRAAELLERQLAPGAAEIVQCHQLTPELAARFESASIVIFLDAACDQRPGAVVCEPVSPSGNPDWSHQLSPAQLLGLSLQLGAANRPGFVIRGGALRMGFEERLTEVGERTAAVMAHAASGLLRLDPAAHQKRFARS